MRVNPKITFSYFFKEHYKLLALIPLWFIGSYVEEYDYQNWTKFRDRSALYGGMKKPDEAPSW